MLRTNETAHKYIIQPCALSSALQSLLITPVDIYEMMWKPQTGKTSSRSLTFGF